MKHKLKKILLLYLFTGTLFVSCTTEEDVVKNENYKNKFQIREQSYQELIKVNSFKRAMSKIPKQKTSTTLNGKTVMEEQYGFSIIDTPIKITETDETIAYNLLVKSDTITEGNYFENLLINIDKQTDLIKAYLVKYNLEDTNLVYTNHNSFLFNGTRSAREIVYNSNPVQIFGKEMFGPCISYQILMCSYQGLHVAGAECIRENFDLLSVQTQTSGDCSNGLDPIDTSGGIGGTTSSGGTTSNGHTNEDTTNVIDNPTPLCPTCPEFSDKDCNITVEQLQQLFPNSTADIRNKLAEMINEVANDFGIDTKNEICHFLAQTGAETGGFITLNATEGLNYTSANRLLIVYPSKFSLTDPSLANPNNYLNNPQALANYVYCCKYGNGNEASGDGWRYRGRGIVQLTWKSNYDAYVNFLNNIGLGWSYSNPDIIESDYRHSIVSGMWFFKQNVLDKMEINDATTSNSVTKKVNRYAPKDTKIIRQNYLNSAKNIINCQ